jgi:hypothetical protein
MIRKIRSRRFEASSSERNRILSKEETIDFIEDLVGNYSYGIDDEGYLSIKSPKGDFKILIADDLGVGVVAVEEIVERGSGAMKMRDIERLIKKYVL